ncbi:MAG: propionyl-CoA carboxylase, partial [Alphaproteobacteria bacterium]|nr:propionyl-CoA carboxylase [Alphaproteobacteria bacterium]
GGIAQSRNGLDHVVAWPSGEWGSLPLAGGVAVAHKNEIESAPDPKAREREIEDELAALASPFRTAEAFGITDILDPADTRPYLARFARLARDSMTHRLGPKAKFGVRP